MATPLFRFIPPLSSKKFCTHWSDSMILKGHTRGVGGYQLWGRLCYIKTSLRQLCKTYIFDFYVKRFMKTPKKNIHFTINISIYMTHRHFKVLWRFILHILWRFIFSLENSCYAYMTLQMHKILKTLGNEKEQKQIKFYKKCWASWFSSRFSELILLKSKVTAPVFLTQIISHWQKNADTKIL